MEVFFCGADIGCWAAWLWSPGTAAWIQAAVALSAIWFANKRARDSFQRASEEGVERERKERIREREREHMTEMKAISRVKVVMLTMVHEANTFLLLTKKTGAITLPKMEGALFEIRGSVSTLRRLALADLPNPKIMVYVSGAASGASDFVNFIQFCVAQNNVTEKTVLAFETFVAEMMEYHDDIQEFHDRFANDPDADFQNKRKSTEEIISEVDAC